MASPKVSVFIPVYRHAAYVGEAVDSVLSQDFKDFELILVDDKSPDDSYEIIARYDDPRIRLYRNAVNLGISANRNRMFDLVRGEYVALLDSDDRMAPRRLSRQVAFLEANPHIATLGGCVAHCDQEGRPQRRLMRPLATDQLHPWMLFRTAHANTTFMGRMSILRHHRYDEDYFTSGDYELSLRLAQDHRSANLSHVLSHLRQHDGRTTSTASDRVRQEKFRLIERQVARLGLSAEPADIARHHKLTRLSAADLRGDPEFIDWAPRWLEGIVAANDRTQVYDRQATRRVMGFVWAQTCLKAAKTFGASKAWKHFAGSPLRRGCGGMVGENLTVALRQAMPRKNAARVTAAAPAN